MEEWRGEMDWPRDANWRCEICDGVWLIWGFVHAQCRCQTCHTQYRMRDEKGERVIRPICQLRPEYYEVAKTAWQKDHKPIDEYTHSEWIKLGVKEVPVEDSAAKG